MLWDRRKNIQGMKCRHDQFTVYGTNAASWYSTHKVALLSQVVAIVVAVVTLLCTTFFCTQYSIFALLTQVLSMSIESRPPGQIPKQIIRGNQPTNSDTAHCVRNFLFTFMKSFLCLVSLNLTYVWIATMKKTTLQIFSPEINTTVSDLKQLDDFPHTVEENQFWIHLRKTYNGNDVNIGKSAVELSRGLCRLRYISMSLFLTFNLVWFTCLSCIYIFTGSDVICYCVASAFSFSLLIQLIGLTCYKCNYLLRKYLKATDITSVPLKYTS